MNEPSTPKIYAAIAAVQAAIAKDGISKDRRNEQQGYKFRGIDDIYNAVAPLLAANGLCIMPTYTNRTKDERTNQKGTVIFNVTVEGTFDFVSTEDGSKHTVKTFGEAMDSGDKATNKAMSAAYKYACMQTFCIPTEGDNDADSSTHEVLPKPQNAPGRAATTPPPSDTTPPVKVAVAPSQEAKPAVPKVATANTRAFVLDALGCQEEGPARNFLHSYLVALGWLKNEKVVEQWPARFVPISKDEIEALKVGLAEFSLNGNAVRPYQPHGLDPDTLISKPTLAPAAPPPIDLPPPQPGWRDYTLTFGAKTKGKTLGSFPEPELRNYIDNFVVRESVENADGTKQVYDPAIVAEQKALRAALDEAAKELKSKQPKEPKA